MFHALAPCLISGGLDIGCLWVVVGWLYNNLPQGCLRYSCYHFLAFVQTCALEFYKHGLEGTIECRCYKHTALYEKHSVTSLESRATDGKVFLSAFLSQPKWPRLFGQTQPNKFYHGRGYDRGLYNVYHPCEHHMNISRTNLFLNQKPKFCNAFFRSSKAITSDPPGIS